MSVDFPTFGRPAKQANPERNAGASAGAGCATADPDRASFGRERATPGAAAAALISACGFCDFPTR